MAHSHVESRDSRLCITGFAVVEIDWETPACRRESIGPLKVADGVGAGEHYRSSAIGEGFMGGRVISSGFRSFSRCLITCSFIAFVSSEQYSHIMKTTCKQEVSTIARGI